MSTTTTSTNPTRKTKKWLTRDQRLAVQTACTADSPTPRKSRGQRRKLSEDQLDEIIEFITSSEERRRMPYETVIKELQLPVCKSTLREALARRGYHRSMEGSSKTAVTERTSRAMV
ncbi:hypothetical protein N7461_000219 [Penicillium sp. DV-2018c]|nr:hypothetical protein N7461_000219 [Penicillium sp. DV-2018c]